MSCPYLEIELGNIGYVFREKYFIDILAIDLVDNKFTVQ